MSTEFSQTFVKFLTFANPPTVGNKNVISEILPTESDLPGVWFRDRGHKNPQGGTKKGPLSSKILTITIGKVWGGEERRREEMLLRKEEAGSWEVDKSLFGLL